jgi:tetratricopeptide (TPR) repeat protein
MSLPGLLLIVGFTYIIIWGGLLLLRREGLSMRFALEGGAVTLITSGLAAWTSFQPQPILFLFLLYLITMRVRLLVELANVFAQRCKFEWADTFYNLANRMWPDPSGYFLILINSGVSYLQRGETERAIDAFNNVLQKAGESFLGLKSEAATHYNLGQAYLRKDMGARAVLEFNKVIDIMPASPYAQHAQDALEQGRKKTMGALQNK